MIAIEKNGKFSFKPREGEKFNILQKVSWRGFFVVKQPIISSLSYHPRTSKPNQMH